MTRISGGYSVSTPASTQEARELMKRNNKPATNSFADLLTSKGITRDENGLLKKETAAKEVKTPVKASLSGNDKIAALQNQIVKSREYAKHVPARNAKVFESFAVDCEKELAKTIKETYPSLFNGTVTDPAQIKKELRELLKITHPDKGGSTELFQAIQDIRNAKTPEAFRKATGNLNKILDEKINPKVVNGAKTKAKPKAEAAQEAGKAEKAGAEAAKESGKAKAGAEAAQEAGKAEKAGAEAAKGAGKAEKAAAEAAQGAGKAEQAAAEAAQGADKAEKAAAEAAQGAGKAEKAAAEAVQEASKAGKKPGIFSRISKSLGGLASKFKNMSKCGKLGIIAGAAVLVLGGLAWGISKLSAGDDDKKDETVNPVVNPETTDNTETTTEETPVAPVVEPADTTETDDKTETEESEEVTAPDNKTKTDEAEEAVEPDKEPKKDEAPVPVVVPHEDKADDTDDTVDEVTDPKEDKPEVKPEDKADETDKVEDKVSEDDSKVDAEKVHIVKYGDNVWNIAKQHLKDMNTDPNYRPTNAEILKHTKELMELNGLKFEADGYHCMIRPDDRIKLVA